MIFGRRGEKRAPLLTYERILVPLAGTEADDAPLRLTALLLGGTGGQAALLHVIEVPFERQLDAEDPKALAFADEMIERAEAFLVEREVVVRTGIAQARAAGAAIVDDAVEQNADLIVMGLRYKKRFGGGWDAGRTVPYVMRNSTAPVWCLRAETEDLAHTPMRIIIVGCGRVGAQTAAELDQRGEHVTVIDVEQRAFNRLPSTFGGVTVRGSGGDEDIQRSAGAEMCDLLMALTEGDNRNAMAAQLGKHVFGIPRVIAKINDPVRAEAYRSLGLETICRTVILASALTQAAIDGAESTDGQVQPPTAEPMRGAPAAGTKAAKEAEEAHNAAVDPHGGDGSEAETQPEAAATGDAGEAG